MPLSSRNFSQKFKNFQRWPSLRLFYRCN